MNNVIFLQLNEFNRDLLKDCKLPNIQKLTQMHETKTHTDDTYESDFLEPWVQWVSVHTGKTSKAHQIKHLGDVPHLETKQFWETLSESGISSGIWGSMNASRGSADRCSFFLPDPWTASEIAYPAELNHLLNPLRYLSKNYLNRSNGKILSQVKDLLKLFSSHKILGKVIREVPQLAKNALRYRGEHFPFISWLDYCSTLLFQKYREKHKPRFSMIFLNSLAHLQHHHWHGDRTRLNIGLKYLDRCLGELFKGAGIFIAANALSQKNTNEETPWILYRQNDQAGFLGAVGISFAHVEPHMTHDAHIYFATDEECQRAKRLLEGAQIDGKPLFLVEDYPQDPKKLFYRICFTDKIPQDTQFTIGQKSYPFFKLFTPIVQRTGRHIPHGTLYCNVEHFPPMIQNHEIADHIFRLF